MFVAVAGQPAPSPPVYVAWGGQECGSSTLQVPLALARCLGLAAGTRVAWQVTPPLPAAAHVAVEPLGHDDWEVLELNAGMLEAQLLSQVGGVGFKSLGSGLSCRACRVRHFLKPATAGWR